MYVADQVTVTLAAPSAQQYTLLGADTFATCCLLCMCEHQVSGLVAVGTSVNIAPFDSGEIICFANDANSLYTDNGGSLTVTVTRLNWPNASTAEPNYVPYFAEAPTLGL
jgi:hypothetical protein